MVLERIERAQETFVRFLVVTATAAITMVALVSQELAAMQPPQQVQVALPPPTFDAIVGEPFGVGLIEIPLDSGVPLSDPPRIVISDPEGRIFYPGVGSRQIELVLEPVPPIRRPLARGIIDRLRTAIREGRERGVKPKALTVQFLFKGTAPLEVELAGDISKQVTLEPRQTTVLEHQSAMRLWWSTYTAAARGQIERVEARPLLPLYLTSMLQSRLKLPAADLPTGTGPTAQPLEEPLSTLALLAGIEPLRSKLLLEASQGSSSTEAASLPVPPEPEWSEPTTTPIDPSSIEIEPLASRVPPECFYIRFGSFQNYLWFQDLSSQYGGDIAQMVTLRALTFDSNNRIETTLNTRTTLLSKLFGDSVIEDMAIVGRDLYLQEGATLGVLFRAKNRALLASSLQGERSTTAKTLKNEGCTLRDVEIAGKKVSLLSTPDNRVRSFLVEDGQYIMVTTSQTMVERFLAVGSGAQSLGQTASFRLAREVMPEPRNYSVFAYFSPEFFRALVGPQYQIELRRRLDAIARLEMVEMAQQVAQSEQLPGGSVETLIASGLLPKQFNDRSDGAQVLDLDGHWVDSMRGGRGHFLPIADVPLTAVTSAEGARYNDIASFYQSRWRQMDPLIVGVRRFALPDQPDREQVTIEGYVAPFDAEKYGWVTSLLGPPTPIEIGMPPDDIASFQIHMKGKDATGTPEHHLFGGIKDMVPPDPEETKGLIRTIVALKSMPAYLGGWPMPGLLDRLPLGLGGGPPDRNGYSRLLIGLWRWQGAGFSLLSFDRSILESAVANLGTVEVPDPAQVRLRVGNLAGSQLATWLNRYWYQRGYRASLGNAVLLENMQQQLRVPSDLAVSLSERLLDAKLQCPLGGEYEPSSNDRSNGAVLWRSTAWQAVAPGEKMLPPEQYSAPWMGWFRGGRAHLTQMEDRLLLLAQLELQRTEAPAGSAPAVELPKMDFDLFSLPFKVFGEGKKEEKVEPPQAKEEKGTPRRKF